MKGILQNNLELLREKNSYAAFTVGINHDQEIDGPSEEQSTSLISQQDLKTTEVFFVVGLGTGRLYLDYLSWLKHSSENSMVFIEQSGARIGEFLKQAHAGQILQDPQVEIVLLTGDDHEGFKKIGRKFLFQRIKFVKLPYYPDGETLKKTLQTLLDCMILSVSDYKDFGIEVLKNIYQNFLKINPFFLQKMQGALDKTPAIICGAGPSLDQHITDLKKYAQNAVVFAGGSAIEALQGSQTPLHFAAAVDPFCDRIKWKNLSATQIPLFYFNRLKHNIITLHQGEKVLAGTSGAHPIEDWLYNTGELPLLHVDGGWDVTNFSAAVAAYLGCDPIIFIGVDHCGFEDRMYCNHVLPDAREEEFIDSKNMQGDPVLSKRDWIMSTHWLSQFIQNTSHLQWFNCSRTGLKIEGASSRSLESIFQSIGKDRDLAGECHAIMENMQQDAPTKSQKAERLQELADSFKEVEKLCFREISRLRESQEDPFPTLALLESEPAYLYILEPLWTIWQFAMHRKWQSDPQLQRMLFFLTVSKEHLTLCNEYVKK